MSIAKTRSAPRAGRKREHARPSPSATDFPSDRAARSSQNTPGKEITGVERRSGATIARSRRRRAFGALGEDQVIGKKLDERGAIGAPGHRRVGSIRQGGLPGFPRSTHPLGDISRPGARPIAVQQRAVPSSDGKQEIGRLQNAEGRRSAISGAGHESGGSPNRRES